MKKCFKFVALSFVFLLCFALIFANKSSFNVKADAKSLQGAQTLVVVGSGEVEVKPDTVKVNFGLRTRAENLLDGQTKMKDNIANLVSSLKEYDKDAKVYVNYSSSYPVSEGGLLMYEYDANLVASSKKTNEVNGLIDRVITAGATRVSYTTFTLEDKEEAYLQALVKAKENAESKVKAMYENTTLKALKEENTYNYCESSNGENLKVQARVKAVYEIGDNVSKNVNTLKSNKNNGVPAQKTNGEVLGNKNISEDTLTSEDINKLIFKNENLIGVGENRKDKLKDNQNDSKNIAINNTLTNKDEKPLNQEIEIKDTLNSEELNKEANKQTANKDNKIDNKDVDTKQKITSNTSAEKLDKNIPIDDNMIVTANDDVVANNEILPLSETQNKLTA